MFWHIDDRLPANIQAVLDTAALLDITEFRVFELAHVNWYGRRAQTRDIEPLFVDYMFNDIVPPWVAQFTRKVLRLYHEGVDYMFNDIVPPWVAQFTRKVLRLYHEGDQGDQGQVDRGALGLQPTTRKAHYAARGGWYLLTLTLSLALLLLLANSAVEVSPFLRECYFPPCY